MECDLLIKCGMLLTMQGRSASCLSSGYVALKNEKILACGPQDKLPAELKAGNVLDASGKLVMPGLVNGHTHAAMTLFRGLADDLPLMTWLQDYIFPAEARCVTPEMVYWCSKLAAAEMLLSGTTTVADGYFHEDMAARAFSDAGLRAVAAQGIIDFPAPGVPDPAANIQVAEKYLKEWSGQSTLVVPAVFCHSPYTCSPDTLQRGKRLARQFEVPFFIHVAETQQEVSQVKSQYGSTPVRHLDALGLLDEKTVCIHCVHLDGEETLILKERGTKIVTCPESNMKLSSGCAPLPEMLRTGLAVGLGTDGCASNNDLDIFGEMDSCAKLHKLVAMDPTIVRAGEALAMATIDGAGVLGLDRTVGSLEPGKLADLILVDLQQPHLSPFYNADLLVYAGRGADVTDVFVNGRRVVENRRLTGMDLDMVFAKVRRLSESMRTPSS